MPGLAAAWVRLGIKKRVRVRTRVRAGVRWQRRTAVSRVHVHAGDVVGLEDPHRDAARPARCLAGLALERVGLGLGLGLRVRLRGSARGRGRVRTRVRAGVRWQRRTAVSPVHVHAGDVVGLEDPHRDAARPARCLAGLALERVGLGLGLGLGLG